MDALATIALQGGPPGLLALVFVSVLRGWLVPRRTHLEIVHTLESVIAKLEATVDEKNKQIGILLGRTTP